MGHTDQCFQWMEKKFNRRVSYRKVDQIMDQYNRMVNQSLQKNPKNPFLHLGRKKIRQLKLISVTKLFSLNFERLPNNCVCNWWIQKFLNDKIRGSYLKIIHYWQEVLISKCIYYLYYLLIAPKCVKTVFLYPYRDILE